MTSGEGAHTPGLGDLVDVQASTMARSLATSSDRPVVMRCRRIRGNGVRWRNRLKLVMRSP